MGASVEGAESSHEKETSRWMGSEGTCGRSEPGVVGETDESGISIGGTSTERSSEGHGNERLDHRLGFSCVVLKLSFDCDSR